MARARRYARSPAANHPANLQRIPVAVEQRGGVLDGLSPGAPHHAERAPEDRAGLGVASERAERVAHARERLRAKGPQLTDARVPIGSIDSARARSFTASRSAPCAARTMASVSRQLAHVGVGASPRVA